MFLRHEKKFIEIDEEQARAISDKIDRNKKIPIGLERLDPMKCELVKELPPDWNDKGYIVVYQKKQLQPPEIKFTPYPKRTPEQREKINNLISEARFKLKSKGFNV